ncbi:MAG: hypothetical protein AAFZ80_02480 [Cyanobacteria bacterium P01_A01_bin.105]
MASRSQKQPPDQPVDQHHMCFICADVVSKAEEQHTLFYRGEHAESADSGIVLCPCCYRDHLAGRLKIDFYLNGLG